MSLKNVIIASLAVLLTGSLVAAHYATKDKDARINELENELAELKKLANRSTIDKIISQQLEEKISDERRREAELQSALARQKTQEAEAERKRAEIAKNEAIESEKNARQAQENAEKQRQIAEENQRKAEYSKSVVDTLSFVGLGHNTSRAPRKPQRNSRRRLAISPANTRAVSTTSRYLARCCCRAAAHATSPCAKGRYTPQNTCQTATSSP